MLRVVYLLVILLLSLHQIVLAGTGPRPLNEIKQDLVQWTAQGLSLKSLDGLEMVPPEKLVANASLLSGILEDLQYGLEYGDHNYILEQPNRTFFGNPSNRIKIFSVLVDLYRHALRSNNLESQRSALSGLSPKALQDDELLREIVALGLSTSHDDLRKAAGRALYAFKTMSLVVTDSGQVRLENLPTELRNSLGNEISLKLLEAWQSGNVATIRAASTIQKELRHRDLPLQGWRVLSQQARNEWKKLPIELKKLLVETIEQHRVADAESATLVIGALKANPALPLRLAWIRALALRGANLPNVAPLLRELLQDPRPMVRAEAARSLAEWVRTIDDMPILDEAFKNEPDDLAKGPMAAALLRGWSRTQSSEQLEIAARSILAYMKISKEPLQSYLGRTLYYSSDIPESLKIALGIDEDSEICVRALTSENPWPTPNIWLEE